MQKMRRKEERRLQSSLITFVPSRAGLGRERGFRGGGGGRWNESLICNAEWMPTSSFSPSLPPGSVPKPVLPQGASDWQPPDHILKPKYKPAWEMSI